MNVWQKSRDLNPEEEVPGICVIIAAYPFLTQSSDDFIFWVILHRCGVTENIISSKGNNAPRKVRCDRKYIDMKDRI